MSGRFGKATAKAKPIIISTDRLAATLNPMVQSKARRGHPNRWVDLDLLGPFGLAEVEEIDITKFQDASGIQFRTPRP